MTKENREEEIEDAIADLSTSINKLKNKKNFYLKKMERSTGLELYKFYLLFNSAALDEYVYQSREQAKESFNQAKSISLFGFVIISAGITLAFAKDIFNFGSSNDTAALITTACGVIVELIAGTVFLIYNRTLKQVSLFSKQISNAQKDALSLLVSGEITEDASKSDYLKNLTLNNPKKDEN